MQVDETLDVNNTLDPALIAEVMDSLNAVDTQPPQDEYAGNDPPPAYDNFRDSYAQWRTTYKAKLALVAYDNDPAVAATNKELDEAKKILKDMKIRRYGALLFKYRQWSMNRFPFLF